MRYPNELFTLIGHLKKLPGVGRKSAERLAFALIDWSNDDLQLFSKTLSTVKEKIKFCETCGCLLTATSCEFCDPSKREQDKLCIIASVKDVFNIESTATFKGLYHVLGSLLSPIEGKFDLPEEITKITRRIQERNIKEIVIALDSTVEGDTTALLIKKELAHLNLPIYRLAFGIPLGSSLDFIDGGTLAQALLGKQSF